MTKFTSLSKKEKLETKFTHALFEGTFKTTKAKPVIYDNVLHIGYDDEYGDVFKAWDDDWESTFVLFLVVKGDEFD